MSPWLIHVSILGLVLGLAGPALAQNGSVEVQVQDSAGRVIDGSVRLKDSGGQVRGQCTTTAGRCTIRVAAGAYRAELTPQRGTAPAPAPVTVAANAVARLTLRAGAATTTTTATSTTTTATSTPTGRNLGSGSRAVVQGQIQDGGGRPVDGTVTVKQGGQPIGYARSAAGRFSLFDLPAGSYNAQVTTTRGGTGSANFTVGAGVANLVLRAP